MKRIRSLLLIVLFAVLAACTTVQKDLKSPCAGCDDAIQPRIDQRA